MERRADAPRRRRSYCRRDGWLCTPAARCDEHRIDRDPARLAEIIAAARAR